LPAIFSTVRDKWKVVVATPRPIQVAIELLLYVVAILAPRTIWPLWLAVLTTAIALIVFPLGLRPIRWLLKGAPSISGEPKLQTEASRPFSSHCWQLGDRIRDADSLYSDRSSGTSTFFQRPLMPWFMKVCAPPTHARPPAGA